MSGLLTFLFFFYSVYTFVRSAPEPATVSISPTPLHMYTYADTNMADPDYSSQRHTPLSLPV